MAPPPPISSKISIVSSSPGRAEKLPTPVLARLLPAKSASRTRTQTSLFPSRNLSLRRAAPSLNSPINSEPSSPKVTCIGQVRITKKNPTDSKTSQSQSEQSKKFGSVMRCCLFRCKHSIRGRKDRVETTEAVSLPLNDVSDIVLHKSEEVVPPKNALILMRCRSAPHNRSSALATRKEEGQVVKVTESKKFFEEEMRCVSARPLVLKRSNSEPAVRLVVPEVAQESIATAIKN